MILALLAIASAGTQVLVGDPQARSLSGENRVTPNPVLNMMARYGFGLRRLLTEVNHWDDKTKAEIETALDSMTRQPVDQFRVEVVRGFLNSRPPNPNAMQKIETAAPWLHRDMEVLAEVQQMGRETPAADWEWFLARHGWIAKAAHAQALPASDPAWKALEADAMRTTVVMVLALMAMAVALMGGLVLLVVAFIRWQQGKLVAAMERPPEAWGGVLLEAFAIYLCGWTLVPAALHLALPGTSRWVLLGVAALVTPVALLWPLWRGLDRKAWRETIGLHTGKGVWKEIGAGILGWIAATPIIAVGLWAAQWIAQKTHADMTHPIIEPLTTPGAFQIAAVLLAVVWAPLAEESMFRGLLFPGLAARLRWVMGALIGAFIFAVIHPQGWAAVPAIMAIALAASMLRLVRGSLIAPMALHAMNNGTLVAMLILCAG
jgi:membrane protease YdiL (CAAX protease family)